MTEWWGIWCQGCDSGKGQWLRIGDQLRLFDSVAEAEAVARQLDREINAREAVFSYEARAFR
jgi:hypothetical protein